MGQLSKDEQKMLKQLQAKAEAPDAPPVGRSVTAHVDLSDPKQVSLAQRFGFLSADDEDDDDDDDAQEDEETPKRKGFFE